MTDKAVFDAIRHLELAVQKNDGEWTLDYRREDPRRVSGEYGTRYHTDDPQDALATARIMAEWKMEVAK